MDLKDLIKSNRDKTIEAHNAFHAGHHDIAEKYLMEQMLETAKYFNVNTQAVTDVTAPNDTQKQDEVQSEKPDEVPDAQVRPAARNPVDVALQNYDAQRGSKPTQ